MSSDGRNKNIVSVCPRTCSLPQLWTNITAVTLHQNMLPYFDGIYFNQLHNLSTDLTP